MLITIFNSTHESPELYGLTGGANTAAVFALVLAVPAALAILKLRPDSQPTPKANTTATKAEQQQRKESKRPATQPEQQKPRKAKQETSNTNSSCVCIGPVSNGIDRLLIPGVSCSVAAVSP